MAQGFASAKGEFGGRKSCWRALLYVLACWSSTTMAAPLHGGQLFSQYAVNFEVVAKGPVVTVYLTEGDQPLSSTGATGYVSFKEWRRVRRFELLPVGGNRLQASHVDPPLEPGDLIHVHVAPAQRAEKSMAIEVPGEPGDRQGQVMAAEKNGKTARHEDPATWWVPSEADAANAPVAGRVSPTLSPEVPAVAPRRVPQAKPESPNRKEDAPTSLAIKNSSWSAAYFWIVGAPVLILFYINGLVSRKLMVSPLPGNRIALLSVIWLFPLLGAWIIHLVVENSGQDSDKYDANRYVVALPGGTGETLTEFFSRNSFYVLELQPEATRADVERAGQRLLALLEIGNEQSRQFTTPFGSFPRSSDGVRQAVATLREPRTRVLEELWVQVAFPAEGPPGVPGWEDAGTGLGWNPPGQNQRKLGA